MARSSAENPQRDRKALIPSRPMMTCQVSDSTPKGILDGRVYRVPMISEIIRRAYGLGNQSLAPNELPDIQIVLLLWRLDCLAKAWIWSLPRRFCAAPVTKLGKEPCILIGSRRCEDGNQKIYRTCSELWTCFIFVPLLPWLWRPLCAARAHGCPLICLQIFLQSFPTQSFSILPPYCFTSSIQCLVTRDRN